MDSFDGDLDLIFSLESEDKDLLNELEREEDNLARWTLSISHHK